jgi:hypothetical protein
MKNVSFNEDTECQTIDGKIIKEKLKQDKYEINQNSIKKLKKIKRSLKKTLKRINYNNSEVYFYQYFLHNAITHKILHIEEEEEEEGWIF